MNKEFSLSMSVYRNDNPEHFRIAVESVTIHQTLSPSEMILVVDGPVPVNIDKVINELQKEITIPFNLIRLPRNLGHAGARQTGLKAAKYEYVAIMDSDDISLPDRFEKQMHFFEQHPNVDVLGGQIAEFIDDQKNIVGERIVPESDEDIKIYMKSRCPMNLVTVIGKTESIQKVGGYIDWYCEEDYYLWIRMMLANCKFANIPDILVNVRVGKEMYSRRGGCRYFKSEAKLQKLMFHKHIISFPRFIFNVFARLAVQVLMPNSVRGFIFQKLFRKKVIKN